MMRDKLSKREDRALHQALASVVLTQFPESTAEGLPWNVRFYEPSRPKAFRCAILRMNTSEAAHPAFRS